MTPQQWDVLNVAVSSGYYDTPRRCTQEQVAEKLVLAKSTCSETLHRAEKRVIKSFLESRTAEAGGVADAPPVKV